MVIQESFRVFQCRLIDVLREGCLKGISKKFKGCFEEVLKVFQGTIKGVYGIIKGVSRKF